MGFILYSIGTDFSKQYLFGVGFQKFKKAYSLKNVPKVSRVHPPIHPHLDQFPTASAKST